MDLRRKQLVQVALSPPGAPCISTYWSKLSNRPGTLRPWSCAARLRAQTRSLLNRAHDQVQLHRKHRGHVTICMSRAIPSNKPRPIFCMAKYRKTAYAACGQNPLSHTCREVTKSRRQRRRMCGMQMHFHECTFVNATLETLQSDCKDIPRSRTGCYSLRSK